MKLVLGIVLASMCWLAGMTQADVTRTGDDKKRDKKLVVTPEAKDLKVSFVVGQSVEIELMGSVGSLKRVEFLIRQGPAEGSLSALRAHPKDNNKVLVTYTHRDVNAPMQDAFTYACRLEGGPISAPATVSLIGRRFDPQLEVINAPQFSRVIMGGETSARVLVKNKGPAPYSSSLKWEMPWSGPSLLEVGPGQLVEFRVTFKPAKPGNFRSQIELQPGLKESTLFLYGDGVQLLTISPGRLALSLSAETGERTGELTLVNTLNDPARVSLKLPNRVQGPTSVELAPLGKTEITLRMPAEDKKALQEEISVETGSMVERVPVVAEAKPGELRLVSPQSGTVDFGVVKTPGKATAPITLANVGGLPLIIGAKAGLPFVLEEAGQALRLEPGQERTLMVELRKERAGKFMSNVELSGGSVALGVVVRAEVQEGIMPAETLPAIALTPTPRSDIVPAPRPAPAVASSVKGQPPAQRTVLQSALLSLMASSGLPVPKEYINPYLEAPAGLELLRRTTQSVTLAWEKPEVAPAGWRLEMASTHHDAEQGLFLKTWMPYPSWKMEETDPGKVVMRIHSLRPAGQYEFRIMGLDREGKLSEPSPLVIVETAVPWSIPSWVWRMLIIGALAIMIYVLYKMKRGDFELEF